MAVQFETGVIIGLGQIGGSIGLALKKADFFQHLGGFDIDQEALSAAENFLDFSCNRLEEAFEVANVVLIATPIKTILQLLKLGFERHPSKLYFDLGSTKSAMMELVSRFDSVRYIGGHPLAGSERPGRDGWDSKLFADKPFFITVPEGANLSDVDFARSLILSVGAIPIEVSASEHDEALSFTSHLPLLLSFALTATFAERREDFQRFVGSGMQSMVRLSGSSPEMSRDIFMANKENILKNFAKFKTQLQKVVDLLEKEDADALLTLIHKINSVYWNHLAVKNEQRRFHA